MATLSAAPVPVPAGDAWTLVYTAAGAVTLFLQNRSSSVDLLIRISASATTGDATTAAAEILFARDDRSIPLASGDKVYARHNVATVPGSLSVRTS